jgi:hypothetical protein
MDSDTRLGLDALAEMNELLSRKGMAAYRRLKKEVLTPEVAEIINKFIKPNSSGRLINRPEDKLADKFSDLKKAELCVWPLAVIRCKILINNSSHPILPFKVKTSFKMQ